MNIIVRSPRLIIREFLPDEEELVVAHYHDKEVMRHLSPRTDADTRKRFGETLASYKNSPKFNRWGIFNPEDGDFIGNCKLMPNDTDAGKMELGYTLAKKYWGKGLATELALLLVNYGFSNGLAEICACTDRDNIASQNVLLKAGLKRDGNIFWHGRNIPFFRIAR